MKKCDVAREYRDKYGPSKSTKALARIMYSENKALFTGEEDARSVLRYIEGKHGETNRQRVKKTHHIMKESRPYNPYNLPESDETVFEPFFLNHSKIVVFNDLHAPYHSIPALTAALDYCVKEKPNAVLLNGDMFDFHGLSRFLKDPRKKRFSEELAVGVDLISTIQSVLRCKIYFKLGNHDERYQHFLWQKAGELEGIEEFKFESIIKNRLKNVEVIGDKRIVKAGHLNIIHGHEFGMSVFSPVNIARGLFLKGKVSAMQGHNHVTSEHTEPDMNGKIVTSWSVGCLCELHPAFLPINKWNHGFATVEVDKKSGEFEVKNKRIYKGKVL